MNVNIGWDGEESQILCTGFRVLVGRSLERSASVRKINNYIRKVYLLYPHVTYLSQMMGAHGFCMSAAGPPSRQAHTPQSLTKIRTRGVISVPLSHYLHAPPPIATPQQFRLSSPAAQPLCPPIQPLPRRPPCRPGRGAPRGAALRPRGRDARPGDPREPPAPRDALRAAGGCRWQAPGVVRVTAGLSQARTPGTCPSGRMRTLLGLCVCPAPGWSESAGGADPPAHRPAPAEREAKRRHRAWGRSLREGRSSLRGACPVRRSPATTSRASLNPPGKRPLSVANPQLRDG